MRRGLPGGFATPRQLQRFPFFLWFGVRNVLLAPKEGSPWCWQGDVPMGCPWGARGWVGMCPLHSRGSERCPGCVLPMPWSLPGGGPGGSRGGVPTAGVHGGDGAPRWRGRPSLSREQLCLWQMPGGDPASSGHVTGGDSAGCYLYLSLDRATRSVTLWRGPGVPGAVNPFLGTVRDRWGASGHEEHMPWAKGVPQGPLPCLSPAVPAPPQVTL